jgi:hypothetical protein
MVDDYIRLTHCGKRGVRIAINEIIGPYMLKFALKRAGEAGAGAG